MDPKRQKIAEKLIILNDRGIGLLARISYINKVILLYDKATKKSKG